MHTSKKRPKGVLNPHFSPFKIYCTLFYLVVLFLPSPLDLHAAPFRLSAHEGQSKKNNKHMSLSLIDLVKIVSLQVLTLLYEK